MAVIGKIRSYSGLLIAVIGIALAAFVLGDFMGYGPSGGQTMEVGSIGKSKITYTQFENRVAQQIDNWKQQTGNQNPSQREAFQIRQQVWTQMISEVIMGNEFENLGIAISPDELTDMVYGRNPHPSIIQSFSNPADGTFDPQMVMQFVANLNNVDPSMQRQWFQLEDFIKQQRKETKYHTLIRKGFFFPETLARFDYQDKNATADIRILLKRFNEIDDSLVTVSDRDLRNTYNEHKQQFKREESRDLEYVVFPVFPSEQDREIIRTEVERMMPEFTQSEDVISFVNANSDIRYNPRYYGAGELSPEIEELMFHAEPGTVYGPYEENNAFVAAMLKEVQFRPDSMKAAHILIAHTASMSAGPETIINREQAEQKADSLLNVVRRNPGRFADLASTLSDDPSAISNQGDLGWFPDGAMVVPFNEAVINAPVNSFTVAESDFGFHIIHVTGKSAVAKKVQVVKLARNIEYSNQTYQRVYGQASAFAASLRDDIDFDEAAEEQGLAKRVVDQIRPMDFVIPGIDNPRGIIQWAFAERTQKGSYSQIFDLEGRFVIARITKVREEGIPALDEVRSEVLAIAVREKKAEMFKNDFAAAQGNSVQEKAGSLKLEAREIESMRFNQNNLQGFGNEPAVVGAVFAMEAGSAPVAVTGNAGVYLVEVTRKEDAVEPADWTAQQNQLKNAFRNRVPNETMRALEESAKITDNRHRFF